MVPQEVKKENADQFWLRVDRTDSCWLWTGSKSRKGYGLYSIRTKEKPYLISAHRFAFELVKGPVPAGLTLDHLCRVHNCVNPAHLEAVTTRVNSLRGIGPTAQNANLTHCIRGHEFSGSNLLVAKWGGRLGRHCLECRRIRQRAARAKKKIAGGVKRLINPCSLCERPANMARGWCYKHYRHWRLWGDPTIRSAAKQALAAISARGGK